MKEQAKFVLLTQYLAKNMNSFQLKHVANNSMQTEYNDSRSARTALDRHRIPTSHSHNANNQGTSSPHAVYTHVGLKKAVQKNDSKERSSKERKLPP